MLRSVKFLTDYRVFKKDAIFTFRPGVNFLVGDQGTGKSTLLRLLAGKLPGVTQKDLAEIDSDKDHYGYFDFETDNPRISEITSNKLPIMLQGAVRWSSHGEFVKKMLSSSGTQEVSLFLMDEPDQALSVRSCYIFTRHFNEMAGRGVQILAAVHNPIFISSQPEVLSLEHCCWMPSVEFLQSQERERVFSSKNNNN